MGLIGNEKLWARIRNSATRLPEAAGILLLPATDPRVQTKKWDAANRLEQLYPEVFGAIPGKRRDHSLQKDTSYAVLTSAMDMAKRELRKKRVTEGPSRTSAAIEKRPTRAFTKQKLLTEASGSFPTPFQPTRVCSTPPPTLIPSPVVAGSIPKEDLVLIVTADWTKPNIYSPMTWPDLVLDDNMPKLARVHENLVEDGLKLEKQLYGIQSPDGLSVVSDRALNFLLGRYAKKGVKETEWKIVPRSESSL